MSKTIVVTLVIVLVIATAGYLMVFCMGKPIQTDLSVIGQGKPVLVLAYENYSPRGGEALNQLRKVRGDFDSRLVFVVADMGTPEGRRFADQHALVDGQALLMTQDGQPLQDMGIPSEEQALHDLLEAKLMTLGGNIETASP